jgi:rubrerythrin
MPASPLRAGRSGSRLYARHAAAADRGSWSVERDVRWELIDRERALARPDILAKLRDAAIIESYHPVNLTRLIRLTWDDVDAGVVFSLEMYEGFKHFHVLRTYLDLVGYEPAITDDELRECRRATARTDLDPHDAIKPLVEFMLSEHLASYFFRRLGEDSDEPVLAKLLRLIAADEVRHAQGASDLIAKRIAADPSNARRVLDAAVHFRHYGEQAVDAFPVAMAGDAIAIRTFASRITRLCGMRMVDHLKATLDDAEGTTEVDTSSPSANTSSGVYRPDLQGSIVGVSFQRNRRA